MKDSRDAYIVRTLIENIDGLRAEELRKKCNYNKKPFYRRLQQLVKERVIEKRTKKSKTGKRIFFYRVAPPDEFKKNFLKNITNIEEIVEENWENSKKVQKISSIPHLINWIATSYMELISEYLFFKEGKIYYQAGLEIIAGLLQRLEKKIVKSISQSDLKEIIDQTNFLVGDNDIKNYATFIDVIYCVAKKRTMFEEQVASETPAPLFPYHLKVFEARSTLIADKSLAKKHKKIEEEYLKLRDKMQLLRIALIQAKPSINDINPVTKGIERMLKNYKAGKITYSKKI